MDLNSINLKTGRLYETIITTCNQDNFPNAAPIGVFPLKNDQIVVYLFQGSITLENIRKEGKFAVNILEDPLTFVECTLGNLPRASFVEYEDYFYLKNSDAMFTVNVESMKEVEKEDRLGISKLTIVKARLNHIKQISNCVHPVNRSIYGIIESLINMTRLDLVDTQKRRIYLERLNEISRVIHRVGGPEDIEALKRIKKYYEKYQ
jgi:hypothetical protein